MVWVSSWPGFVATDSCVVLIPDGQMIKTRFDILWVAIGVVLGGCGASEPTAKTTPASAASAPVASAAATSDKVDSGVPNSEPAVACTMTKGLSESCAPCAQARCCSPPVTFTVSKAQALGCHLGCRKPLPSGAPKLADADRAAVIKTCVAHCDGMFEDATGEAVRMDECIATQCNSECITSS